MANMSLTLKSSMIDHPSGLHKWAPWHMPNTKCLEASNLEDPKQVECTRSPRKFQRSKGTTEKLTPYNRWQTKEATNLLFTWRGRRRTRRIRTIALLVDTFQHDVAIKNQTRFHSQEASGEDRVSVRENRRPNLTRLSAENEDSFVHIVNELHLPNSNST
eukprot:2814655-Amphidinium_carterae.1